MNLYSLLACAVIFAGGVCGAGPIFLSAKSRSMDEVPLRLAPLWRETTEGDRFSGCLVVYDWTLPGSSTNAQAETLWEFSSVLSHDAPQGPDAPRVWNAMVHARRYETKQRVSRWRTCLRRSFVRQRVRCQFDRNGACRGRVETRVAGRVDGQ